MATQNNLQSYELMVIFTPVLAEDDFKTAQQKFMDLIVANGGSITYSDPIGLRSLAYPIAKKTTGLYWLMEYQAGSDVNGKLEIQMNRDETIMRQMITRLDKYAKEYNDRRRSGVKHERTTKAESETEA